MTIRIWQAYSCNNSSSYRMIARFTDAATAKAVVAELEEFFPVHAAEIDARAEYIDVPTAASEQLGAKYGIEWNDLLYWGTGPLVDDQPELYVEDAVLIVQHTYCGGGFGDGLPAYLAARGATVEPETEDDICMSVVFRSTPGDNPKLDAELAVMFAQRDDDDLGVSPMQAPWETSDEAHGNFGFFRDAGIVALSFPIAPCDLDNVKAWLAKRGIDRPVIRIGDDAFDFDEIRRARCRSCGGELEYLHPALHDIETPQLVCKPCGGFYEIAAFVPPRKS